MADFKVTPNNSNLSDKDMLEDSQSKVKAEVDFPDIVEDLEPTAAATGAKVTAFQNEKLKHDALEAQLMQSTSNLLAMKKDIMKDFNKWATQIQNAPGIDLGKVQLLHFHVVGSVPKPPTPPESTPMMSFIETNISGKHTLSIIDNLTQKKALPKDILRTDIYAQTGGTKPNNLSELITNGGGRVGEASRGKFVNDLPPGNKGKTEYYILVYISKKTKKPFSYSIVYEATIT